MGTQRQYVWQNQDQTQRLDVAPETSVEAQLRALAFQALQGVYGDLGQGGDLFGQVASGPSVTPEMLALVQQSQNATLAGARSALNSQFQDVSQSIYEGAASRGLLDSSFVPSALGLAGRGVADQLGQIAAQSQAQAAQQLLQLGQSQQGYRLQLLQLRQAMQQFAASPQLLRDLTQFRLATGTSLSHSDSFQKTKATAPTDWLGFLNASANTAASAYETYRNGGK